MTDDYLSFSGRQVGRREGELSGVKEDTQATQCILPSRGSENIHYNVGHPIPLTRHKIDGIENCSHLT